MSTGADWLDQVRRLLEGLAAAPAGQDGEHEHGGERVEGCRYCPHCQVSAVLRGDRPEVSAALADILTTTSNALKTFAAGGAAHGPADPAGAPAGAEPTEPTEPDDEPPPDVERIEIA